MDRREFFQGTVIATLAASVLKDVTLAGATAARAAQGGAAASAQPAPSTPRKLTIDAYTRYLHWLRDPDEIAEAAIDMTFTGVEPTVTQYPGHIDPTKVAQELPAFVKVMEKHGLRVKQIRGGSQTDVSAANVEAIVAAMGQVGATHYWMGTDNYDLTKPILPQLDAIKKKLEKFVALNEKHGTTLMYHTRAGANAVGSVVWDLLYVMKDFDPKYVGLHWDTGHMSLHGGNMWELLMRTAGPYVVAVSWKDRSWQQNLGFLGEGGPYPGPTAAANAPTAGSRGGRGRGAAAPAQQGGEAAGAALPGARGAGVPGGGDYGEGAALPGGRGRGGLPGGRGRGSRDFPLPLAGKTFARGGGWSSPSVPMGEGLVDIFRYAIVLHDLGFNGPMELEAEYPLGGAENGAEKLTLPREQVLGSIKRDLLTIRAALAQSGTGLSI
jgi:sugar phosphate isomerase/epimerase